MGPRRKWSRKRIELCVCQKTWVLGPIRPPTGCFLEVNFRIWKRGRWEAEQGTQASNGDASTLGEETKSASNVPSGKSTDEEEEVCLCMEFELI